MSEPTLQELKELMLNLDKKIDTGFTRLEGEIKRVETEIKRVEGKVETEIKGINDKLAIGFKRVEDKLESDIKRLEGTLSAKIDGLDKRLVNNKLILKNISMPYLFPYPVFPFPSLHFTFNYAHLLTGEPKIRV